MRLHIMITSNLTILSMYNSIFYSFRTLCLNLCYVALFVLPTLSLADSDDSWTLEKTIESTVNSNEIKVYTRSIKDQVLKQFKGETIVDSSMISLLAAIVDLPTIPQWMYNNKKASIVIGDNGKKYLYLQIKGPGPALDRDGVIDVSIKNDNGTITMKNIGVSGVYPKQKGFVRMTNISSTWIMTSINEKQTKLTFIGHADPGGWIPTWIANLVVTKMPSVSLENLQKQAKDKKYQNISIDSIKTELLNLYSLHLE